MVSVKTARRLRMLNQKLTGYSANPRSIPKGEREDIAMMMAAALATSGNLHTSVCGSWALR